MASINCYQYMKTVMSRMMPGENATNSQQGQEHPGVVSSKSRIQCTEEARKEALIRQQQTQYTADRRRTRAVLDRMGISTPEDPITSPHPIPAHRPSCLPSVKLRPLSKPPCNADVVTNSQTPSTQKQQKRLKNKKAGNVPLDRQFSQTCLTPCTPPLPPPPPSSAVTPEPMNGPSGADKKVSGRYRCPTATMEKIQRRLETIERDLAVSSLHRPLATPRGKPATAPVTPACPPEPVPLKKKQSNRRRTIKPVNIVNTGQRTIYHELAEEFQHFLQTTLREKEEKKRLAEEEDRIHQLPNMDYTTACHLTTPQPTPQPFTPAEGHIKGVNLKPANAVNTAQETIHLELEEEFGRVLKTKMGGKDMKTMLAKEIQTYWLPTDYTAKIFCRPTAYIPEHSRLPLPKPYGAMAPFMPDPPGCQMRHYRKPKVKPIVI